MEQVDERLSRYIGVDGAGPRGVLGIGVESGGAAAPLNATARDLARAANVFRAQAVEVKASRLLDSEKSAKVASISKPLVDALRSAATTFDREAARVKLLSQTVSYVRQYDQGTAYHTIAMDQALLQKFASLDIAARTQIVQRAISEPATNLRWSEVLLRAPIELTGLADNDRTALRFATLRTFAPDEATAVDAQLQQVAHARRALQVASQVLAEDSVSALMELRSVCPQLHAALSEA